MRLLTRSDFDGLICSVLLKEIGIMDDWKFVHPKDLQDGTIQVTENDILANVPFVPGCGMWFDHHTSEFHRHGLRIDFKGASLEEPSCARVIWDYYGGLKAFPQHFEEMMHYVDKCDSGNLTVEEIENPTGWVLLGFIMDPRTGLGRYKDYSISNYQLMEELIGFCRTLTIDRILELPDVKERVARYFEQEKRFEEMLQQRATVHGNVVVLDLRAQEEIFTGNRFVIYTMFPQCNISIRVIWGLRKQNIVFTVGHSILNRTSRTDVGRLMLQHGGGGHRRVGTCQVDTDKADAVLKELVAQMNSDG